MNTYTVTFYRETGPSDTDVEVQDVRVESAVDADDVAAGDWDAHELVTVQARDAANLNALKGWTSSHVTLPDGDVAEVPAGL